jgi:phenylalanyl-tRNA synthetase beta chain
MVSHRLIVLTPLRDHNMKFTLSWLKHQLDTTASLDEICKTLTAIGLEVEGVEDRAKIYDAFRVAYVESAVQHPNADRLRVCMVKTEKGTLQVVCGAPNARAGMKGIFAPEGSVIPASGLVLKKGKIRDVESNGMLVSEEEMALPETIDGIIEVDDQYEIGTKLADIYGLNDPVIEINVTPNRADCAGVRGIARDLAAAGLGTLRSIDYNAPESTMDSKTLYYKAVQSTFKSPVSVKIEDDGCKLFVGRYIKGVKNGPSPAFLQERLKAVGLRPISMLVDITNLLSIGAARPLHVYDADKLKGNITVRATQKGQKLEALNDKTYSVTGGAIGIYDDSQENGGLLGLGGIVGGVSTGCDEHTKNVFIESAWFEPSRISRTGREMDIITDARYRFERGVDPELTMDGIHMASSLILGFGGGEASEIVIAGTMPQWQREIEYDFAYTKKRIGVDIDEAKQKKILEDLGFKISGKTIQPPSWRADIEGKDDLAEEIARIHSYDHIPAVSVRADASIAQPAETSLTARSRRARVALAARGLQECVTWSFLSKADAALFNDNRDVISLTLLNPISEDLNVMRPSILPNLISAAGRNNNLGFPDVALSETGPAFSSPKPDGQMMVAGGIRAGNMGPRHWSGSAYRAVDAFDAKADAIATLEACGAPGSSAQITRDVPSYYHPGRSGALRLGPTVLAYFGEIHPAVVAGMDIKTPLVGFEVFLQNIPEPKKKGTEKTLLKLEPLQSLSRDFAFLVSDKTEADVIVKAAKSADKALIKDAYVFDIYTGKGVDAGQKSIALAVTIQPRETSLTDTQIDALSKKVIEAVIGKTGGTLRS